MKVPKAALSVVHHSPLIHCPLHQLEAPPSDIHYQLLLHSPLPLEKWQQLAQVYCKEMGDLSDSFQEMDTAVNEHGYVKITRINNLSSTVLV